MAETVYDCLTLNLKIRDQRNMKGKDLAILTEIALAISYYGISLNNKLQVERFINRRNDIVYYDTVNQFCTTLIPDAYDIVTKDDQISVL